MSSAGIGQLCFLNTILECFILPAANTFYENFILFADFFFSCRLWSGPTLPKVLILALMIMVSLCLIDLNPIENQWSIVKRSNNREEMRLLLNQPKYLHATLH